MRSLDPGPVMHLVHGAPTCEVLDASAAAGSLLKAHCIADFLPQLTPTLLSNSASHAHSCYSTGLGDANPAAVCKACLLQDLQEGLSRSLGWHIEGKQAKTDEQQCSSPGSSASPATHVRERHEPGQISTMFAPEKSVLFCLSPSRQSPQ